MKNLLNDLKQDLPAGLVVFLVALPLCLGIALASGAPLFSGVIAGIIGGIVVAIASGSPVSVSGPAAGLTVIVLNSIQQLGSYELFLSAVLLAGVIQVILGFLKAGIIGHYFPSSVIKGMLAAIGLILVFKQIPHALGYDKDSEGDFVFIQVDGENTFSEILNAINFLHPGAMTIAAVSLAILIAWDKPFFKRYTFFTFVPGALVAVVSGIVLNEFFKTTNPIFALENDHLVKLPVAGSLSEFIGQFTLPDLAGFRNVNVYIVAITIAIVASLESLLSVEAADKLDPYRRNTPTDRELKAQGLGNIISGLIGGLPLTAVIVRSSANINAGSKTKKSAIIHGLLLLISVVGFAGVLNKIPLACLAAVLLVVGYKLAKLSLFKSMYALGWEQFIPFVVTIVAILFSDLLKGIGIGMAVSIFFILRNNYKRAYYLMKEKRSEGETITIQLVEDVTFINKGVITLTLDKLPLNSHVIIDGSQSHTIDLDVLEIIHNFKATAALRGIRLELKGIPEFKGVVGH
ncbi:SulP family inorganic anion transporter [Runella slithyformis]|uniref:Sulphate transporter n=1 Tax=Runella slithyformis (strain ATCC 29530 / DSM 19594 / LMG 11500 / NCIMB 11436 / LSU 4) TaxID=761193 RepID=A0A7U4E670_RUNSL|nr:SulP family inorganic anion transporter [Runella slithyformis]AEI48899.1 sulphate transporter [Runella slithyformis DSM 19594]